MRINFSNNFYFSNIQDQQIYNSIYSNSINYDVRHSMTPNNTITFCQSKQIPQEVIENLERQKSYFIGDKPDLYLYDLEKLEGLQNGIDIFDGLSMTQIGYIINNFQSILLKRGCNNACLYCFAEAKTPHYMKINNLTDKIDFEDYKNLLDGFKELNKRFGYNIFNNNYCSLFHDADCSTITLTDKNGKIYDYADLAKMLYDVTGKRIIFDTAGWNLNDKNTQKRMDDLVQKIANSTEYDFINFNISINPFQAIYNKSVELREKKDYENANKLKNIYVERMANVIFTFSPLIGKTNTVNNSPNLDFIFRALYDETDLDGYQRCNLESVRQEIFDKLVQMYKDDLISDNPKVIKSESQINEYTRYLYADFLNKYIGSVNLTNKKLIDKLSEIPSAEREMAQKHTYNSAQKGRYFNDCIIDVNGRVYMTNYIETYPTDIILNYKNKGKPTAPIRPNLNNEVISKDMMHY